MLGTNAGRVHDQHQGTGLATVLQGDRALDTYDYLAAQERTKNAAKKKDLEDAQNAIIKFNPDRWFKHEQVIQQAVDSWHQEGAEITAGKTNPWTATDQKSVDWRKKYVEISGLAQGSKQAQGYFEDIKDKMNGAEPDKYTLTSVKNALDYADTDIREIVGKGMLPPPLEQTRPMVQLQDHFSKVMGAINPTLNGNPLSEEDRIKIVKQTLNDPKMSQSLGESFAALYKQMDPQQMAGVEKRAKDAGLSLMEQTGLDYVDRYADQRKPFNYDTWKKGALERVDVAYKEWRGSDNFSKKVDQAEFVKNTNTIAADSFYGDERALSDYEKVLPRKAGETDGAYQQRATKHLGQKLRDETATQQMAGVTDKGDGDAKVKLSQDNWLRDIQSPNPEQYREAAGYVFQTGDVLGNMTVAKSEVIRGAADANHVNVDNYLHLTLQGDLSLKDVKSQLPDEVGTTITEVQQRGTETEVDIPITPQTENYLLTIHNKRIKQTGIPYQGAFRQTPPKTLRDIFKGSGTPGSPAPGSTNSKVFNF